MKRQRSVRLAFVSFERSIAAKPMTEPADQELDSHYLAE
jgi:hypothetical protein